MKKLIIALVLLAGCTEAGSESKYMGQEVGTLQGSNDVHEFKTPGGAWCVYVDGYNAGGLACDFSTRF